MGKVKKMSMTKQKLATILNRPLSKPRGLASVANKVGQKFVIIKVLGFSENQYKDQDTTVTSINMTIREMSKLTPHQVIVSQRYIKELLKEPGYTDKDITDLDLSGLTDLGFEVVEIRNFGAQKQTSYPELRFFVKSESSEKKTETPSKKKKQVKPKPPIVQSDSDDDEGREEEDVDEDEGSSDWVSNHAE